VASHVYAKRAKRRLMGEINVVPYIDVMLVLLIIFMVTAPLITQGIKVELPKADAKTVDPRAERVLVSVDAAGQLFIEHPGQTDETDRRPLPVERIQLIVAALLRNKPDIPVYVKADKSLQYGEVVKLMSALTQAGAPRVGLMTDPRER
jgi:biopolymer transport protein TolR